MTTTKAPLTDAPDYAPTYDGEVAAVRDIEAHGWTVWWHCNGFGHFDSATAVHPTNPASPMRLTSFERPYPRLLLWWWRPMHQIPVRSIRPSPHRLDNYSPTRTRAVYAMERQQ